MITPMNQTHDGKHQSGIGSFFSQIFGLLFVGVFSYFNLSTLLVYFLLQAGVSNNE